MAERDISEALAQVDNRNRGTLLLAAKESGNYFVRAQLVRIIGADRLAGVVRAFDDDRLLLLLACLNHDAWADLIDTAYATTNATANATAKAGEWP